MTVDAASGSNPYAQLIANSDLATQTNAAKNANKTDTSASAAIAKTKTDKDMFLKLLVAQLKYQDPSKPADTTAFMAQTAQFSALETMQEVATSSGSMVAAQNKLQASALIGQIVTYAGEDGTTKTGVVKSASFTQQSAGGTNNEPVLNVDGVSVVLSKVSGISAVAPAPTTPTAPATQTPATTPVSSSTAPSGTPGATGTTQATGTAPAAGSNQNSGTTGATGSTDSSTPSA